jgi:hypothetical protein
VKRDHIVSVRLTDAEYARLCRRGRPSEVIRQLLDPAGARTVIPVTTCPPPIFMSWSDGTFGQTYPQLVTG